MCFKGNKYFIDSIWDIKDLLFILYVLICVKYFFESIWDISDLWVIFWTLVSYWESFRYCWRNFISEIFLLSFIFLMLFGDCNIIISLYKFICNF